MVFSCVKIVEDHDLVVIDKPMGLLSVATDSNTENTAHAYLKNYFNQKRVFVVHRLDRDTSGVMLFALNERARDRLKSIFEKHDIERTYCAIVEGFVAPNEGTWSSYLYEDAQYIVHATENPKKGKKAITHYSCQKATPQYSLVLLRLETGKKNQIRVHCQNAGYPVAGDEKYGAKTNPLRRLALHAFSLAFEHPFTHKKMRFEIPIPEKFFQIVKFKGNKRLSNASI